jgi:glutamine---fructose-6-phosphate transaminase (isomerizing)
MCGIVGYVGTRAAADFLIEGLRRLEYRGYDSSGVACQSAGGDLLVVKAAGRLEHLVGRLAQSPADGAAGIGHTRWATPTPTRTSAASGRSPSYTTA